MSDHAALDTTFYWDKTTGAPCPREGNVLCTLPYSPDHRHVHQQPLLPAVEQS